MLLAVVVKEEVTGYGSLRGVTVTGLEYGVMSVSVVVVRSEESLWVPVPRVMGAGGWVTG